MALSGRLQFIFENLVPGKDVWDFCCDHGYLGTEALRSGKFGEVHFVDSVPHIVHDLEKSLQAQFPGLVPRARFFACKGEELFLPVSGTAVIAGVGAFTILKILKSLWDGSCLQADRLILCPQRDEEKLLQMLKSLGEEFAHRFTMHSQYILREKKRNRFVYIFDRFSNTSK